MSDSVLFDISTQGYTAWWPAIIGLLFSALGVGAIVVGRGIQRWAGFIGAILGIVFVVAVGFGTWRSHAELQSLLRQGEFQTARGFVREFQEPTEGGHGPETFTVDGKLFEIWDGRGSSYFHRTVFAGGPNLRDKCVEIRFVDDRRTRERKILWLALAPASTCSE